MDEERLAFVSGLTGTSIWEVYLLTFAAGLGMMVRNLGLICSGTVEKWHRNNIVFGFAWEFGTVMLPGLLSFTILSEHSLLIVLLHITLILSFILSSAQNLPLKSLGRLLALPCPGKKMFLCNSRCSVNIFTSIAILAVDFHIFPRRFAKTETYGTGLMDTGVGLYMMCHGFVAIEARLSSEYSSLPSLREYASSLYSCARKLWPFVLLGSIRLAFVKAADYHVHVSEYGVHWNFFFTIALVRFLATVLFPLIVIVPVRFPYALAAFAVCGCYQFCLSKTGLREYILFGPGGNYSRSDFFSANREGLFSCFGYLAIYFIGVEIGRHLFREKNKVVKDYITDMVLFATLLVLSIGVSLLASSRIEDVSRKMANLAFVSWMVSYTFVMLSIAVLNDVLVIILSNSLKTIYSPSPNYDSLTPKPSPYLCILSAIDYNQFVFFLLANLSTGLVNFSVNTLSTESVNAFVILFFHCLCLSVIILCMKHFKLKLV